MSEEVNIFDYLRIIKNKWKLLVCIFVVTEVITLIVTIKIPIVYESTTTTILPSNIIPEKIASTIDSLPYIDKEKLLTYLYNREAISYIAVAILKSRRMAINVTEEFHLKNLYKNMSISEIAGKLQKSTIISITKEGTISVTAKTTDPQLTASIANFYIANLNKINEELKTTSLNPIVTVLDSAVPPNHSSSPKVKFSLLITGVLSIFVSILFFFCINYIENIRLKNA